MTGIRVIVADDRPLEEDGIRHLLVADCGYTTLFYKDFRQAYDAVVRQIGNRLLVNFQLNHPRENGAALLHRIADQQIPMPTVVIDCTNNVTSVWARCAHMDFVRQVVPAEHINQYHKVIRRAFDNLQPPSNSREQRQVSKSASSGRPTVFVIHGHDNTALGRVEKILNSLCANPIVLRKMPVLGENLIDGVESFGSAEFAVALFTGDDLGRKRKGKAKGKEQRLQPRARQNVVFEAGYFRAALQRERLLFLYEEDVEIPSDLDGVRRISLKESDDEITIMLMRIFNKLGIASSGP